MAAPSGWARFRGTGRKRKAALAKQALVALASLTIMSYSKKLQGEIEGHLKTLEAIYFLVQSLEHNLARLQMIRDNYAGESRAIRLRLRDELRDEVRWLRKETGAIAKNEDFQSLLEKIRSYPGYYYLQKIYIDGHLFTNYIRVFSRWEHMKEHAAVIFDGKKNEGPGQIFELEGQCLQDARELLERSKAAEKGIADFRKREKADQLAFLMFARASLIAGLNFVEAYLNGLAYDCFQQHHDRLPVGDHDLLGEWDSSKKRRRFVDFREKVFRYPVIVGRTRGRKVDLSGCKPAHALIDFAKDFRDALVHPSPFVDPKTKQYEKFLIATGVNRGVVEETLEEALEYAEFVEKAIGNDPKLSAPWLYKTSEETGQKLAGKVT